MNIVMRTIVFNKAIEAGSDDDLYTDYDMLRYTDVTMIVTMVVTMIVTLIVTMIVTMTVTPCSPADLPCRAAPPGTSHCSSPLGSVCSSPHSTTLLLASCVGMLLWCLRLLWYILPLYLLLWCLFLWCLLPLCLFH